jgi:hypothetical protein
MTDNLSTTKDRHEDTKTRSLPRLKYNAAVSPAIDAQIDDLYRGPLGDFVAARNSLAKSLSGDEAQRVKKLAKPTVVPWAVNQVYWRARPAWDRVMKTGERLRTAQVSALEGRKVDLRAAAEQHREAVADAVQKAEEIAAQDDAHPAPESLMRTFEALSLAAELSEEPGRLTRPLQPAGFEALAGVKVAAPVIKEPTAAEKRRQAKEEAERQKAEAARKKHEAEVRKAEAALARARQRMAEAEAAVRDAKKR